MLHALFESSCTKCVLPLLQYRDDGGVTNGGQDSSTLVVTLFIGDFYRLIVTPTTKKFMEDGPVSLQVTGGLPSGVLKIHYLWRDSAAGTGLLTEFWSARQTGDGVQKIAGPDAGSQAMDVSNIPQGQHIVYTLLFPAGVVDFSRVETNGAILCPSADSAQVLDSTAPCFLTEKLTITASNATVDQIVEAARNLANNENVDASDAFVTISSAGSAIGTNGDTSTATAQRESLLTNIDTV